MLLYFFLNVIAHLSKVWSLFRQRVTHSNWNHVTRFKLLTFTAIIRNIGFTRKYNWQKFSPFWALCMFALPFRLLHIFYFYFFTIYKIWGYIKKMWLRVPMCVVLCMYYVHCSSGVFQQRQHITILGVILVPHYCPQLAYVVSCDR